MFDKLSTVIIVPFCLLQVKDTQHLQEALEKLLFLLLLTVFFGMLFFVKYS